MEVLLLVMDWASRLQTSFPPTSSIVENRLRMSWTLSSNVVSTCLLEISMSGEQRLIRG